MICCLPRTLLRDHDGTKVRIQCSAEIGTIPYILERRSLNFKNDRAGEPRRDKDISGSGRRDDVCFVRIRV